MPVRRRTFSLVLFLLVIFAFTSAFMQGCVPALPPEPEWEKDARAFLEQAEAFFDKKQYSQAATAADAFLKKYPKSRHGDRALHLLGEIRMQQRDYRNALSYYKELIERYPASQLIPDAKFKLGRCFYELGEYDLAIANLGDRSKITDPVRLTAISEILSAAYMAKKSYVPALREYVFLTANVPNDQQRTGYRDRVREIVDTRLTEDELRSLADGAGYPSDIARLRLAALYMEQRRFRDAAGVSRDFLDRFPSHPEKTRGEMLLNEATSKLTAPRYYLGAMLPQTGQLALFGDRMLKGLQLAVHSYNLQNPDNRVEFILSDIDGSVDKAVAAAKELASKGIIAGIGPLTTRTEEAIAPELEVLRIPFVRPVASRSGFAVKTGWILRNALTIDSQADAAAKYALNMKLRRIVIFYPDDPYGKDLSHLFVRSLERKAEIIASIAYPPDTKDFGPYIRKMMEIDLRSRKIAIPEDEAERKNIFAEYTPSFEALYLPGYAERVGLLIPQLAFYNVTGVAMIGSDNWHSPDLIERAGRHAEGAVFVDGFFAESADPAVRAFVDAYRSAYQEEPDILAAQAYDSAMMIFSLFREGKDTPEAIREGLLSIRDYPGITGSTTFAGSNEAGKKLFLIKVEGGRFTLLDNQK